MRVSLNSGAPNCGSIKQTPGEIIQMGYIRRNRRTLALQGRMERGGLNILRKMVLGFRKSWIAVVIVAE